MIGRRGKIGRNVKRGCSQGSTFGPNFWNLLINKLLNEISGKIGIRVVAYADYLLILVEGNNKREIDNSPDGIILDVMNCGLNVGIEISKENTCMMLYKGLLLEIDTII